ncbi:hypothetical protein BWI95_19680 [Kosakonia cowanii JCM 10956 = DSM 18146]|uniref:Resolvase HTH domain-containing protein n=1 Tax=Kosakonia cowanii JCM 10956 = DSM 18146 TaxID=1300165 RepID=A0A807LLZ5_9ENTR|nr:hypothetical protein BWI95_19680 [Kosakonia cowanii JCM 10956 = DSM 18146]
MKVCFERRAEVRNAYLHQGVLSNREQVTASKRFGRPPVLDEEQKMSVLERIESGATISAIAREFSTSRQTILRVKNS